MTRFSTAKVGCLLSGGDSVSWDRESVGSSIDIKVRFNLALDCGMTRFLTVKVGCLLSRGE